MHILRYIGVIFCTLLLNGQLLADRPSPKLLRPHDGAILPLGTVQFNWGQLPDMQSYQLQLATDSVFSQLIDEVQLNENLYDTVFDTEVSLFWRVRGRVDTLYGDFSAPNCLKLINIHGIGGLSLWLKPDSALATDLSGFVSDWSASGADAQAFLQVEPAFRPQVLDSLNEIPILTFDGTNDYIASNGQLDYSSGSTIIILGRNRIRKNFNYLFELATSILGDRYLELYWARGSSALSSGTLVMGANSAPGGSASVFSPIQNVPPPEGKFYILQIALDASSSSLAVNGQALPPYSNPAGLLPDQPGRMFLGTWGTNDTYLDGDLAELIFFNRKLNGTELAGLYAYLSSKYAPPVSAGEDVYVTYGFCDTVISASKGYERYTWSTGDTTRTISVARDGVYSVSALDRFDQFSTDSVQVFFSLNTQVTEPVQLCSGDTLHLQSGFGAGYSFLWSDGTTDSTLMVTSAGNYWVQIADSLGCQKDSDTTVVITDSLSLIVDLSDSIQICAGNLISLNVDANSIDSIVWSDGSSSSNLRVDSTGRYSVELISSSGCYIKDSVWVEIVGDAAELDFSWQNFCPGDAVQFLSEALAANGDSIQSYLWHFGDGTVDSLDNPSHQYAQAGNYAISLVVTTSMGCTSEHFDSILVLPVDQRELTFSDPAFAGDSIHFNSSGQISDHHIVSFEWHFGDGDSANGETVQHQYLFDGDYLLELEVIDVNGCATSVSDQITILPLPGTQNGAFWIRADKGVMLDQNEGVIAIENQFFEGNFNQADPAFRTQLEQDYLNGFPVLRFDGVNDFLQSDSSFNLTAGMSIFVVARNRVRKRFNYLFRMSQNLNPFAEFAELYWGRGGLNNASGDFIFVSNRFNPGISQVEVFQNTPPEAGLFYLAEVHADISEFSMLINLDSLISVPGRLGYIPRFPASFYIGTYGSADSHLDGDIAEIIVYDQRQTEAEIQRTRDYLLAKYSRKVNLGPDINRSYGLCEQIIDAGEGFTKYRWSTGDTSTTIAVQVAGEYSVTVNDQFGFESADTINVTLPLPELSDTFHYCVNDTKQVQLNLSGAYVFQWSDSTNQPIFQLSQERRYGITVTDTFGCSFLGSFVGEVDSLSLNFNLGLDSQFCIGEVFTPDFEDFDLMRYAWSTGDTTEQIVISNSGILSIAVTDRFGCQSADSLNIISLGQAPQSNFIYDSTLCESDSLILTSLSTGGSSSIDLEFWQLNALDTVFGPNLSTIISNPGLNAILLTVVSDTGCVATKEVYVDVLPAPVADFGLPIVCAGIETQILGEAEIATSADSIISTLWLVSNDTIGDSDTLDYTFADASTTRLNFQVTASTGCRTETSKQLEVFPGFEMAIRSENFCAGNPSVFEAISNVNSIVAWSWNFGDFSIGFGGPEIEHLYADTGQFTVRLLAENAIGCQIERFDTILVSQPPVLSLADSLICSDLPFSPLLSISQSSDDIEQITWSINGEALNNEVNPTFLPADFGQDSFELSVAIETAGACYAQIAKVIEVVQSPEAAFMHDFAAVSGESIGIQFIDQSVNSDSINWFIAGENQSSEEEFVYFFDGTDSVDVSLVALNQSGCMDTTTQQIDIDVPYVDIALASIDIQKRNLNQAECLVDQQLTFVNYGNQVIESFSWVSTVAGFHQTYNDFQGSLAPGEQISLSSGATVVVESNRLGKYPLVCADVTITSAEEAARRMGNNRLCSAAFDELVISEVYPNPVTETIYLDVLPTADTRLSWEIYDFQAAKVEASSESIELVNFYRLEIPTAKLNAGPYLIRLNLGNATFLRKFVKTQ